MAGHRSLIAWQKAMDLTVACYDVSQSLRRVRQADIGSQLLRAAVSVPSNIAEGHGRGTAKDFARFLDMSLGSLGEVDTLLVLTERVHLLTSVTAVEVFRQADEVGRIVAGLRRSKRSPTLPNV
jgi:four helix bundle protein